MAERKGLDRHAGAPPLIRSGGDGFTIHFKIAGVRPGSLLLIRCDDEGNVWVSIGKAEQTPKNTDSPTL